MMLSKYCPSCKQDKPLSDFASSKNRKLGVDSYCRLCNAIKHKEWKDNHREQYKAKRRRTRRSWGFTPRGIYDRLCMNAHNGAGKKVLFSSDEFLIWLMAQDRVCHYCGRKLTMGLKEGDGIKGSMKLTIDRKNNSLPYSIDNIVLSCRRCNAMKGCRLTESETINLAHKRADNPDTVSPSSSFQLHNGTSKLTADEVAQIRQLYRDGHSYSAIASKFGIGKSNVGNIVRRQIWRNLR